MRGISNKAPGYAVGYGKPPAHSRFAKGRSGNPKGRPKRTEKPEKNTAMAIAASRASKMLIEEAYRPVMLREGDRLIELPAIQAVFRAMGVSALKGNRHAQRMLAELVQQAETAHEQVQLEYLKSMIDYKTDWERRIEEARASGRAEPKPIQHPDDIIVDMKHDTVHVWGPRTNEEKQRWDATLKYRDDLQEEVTHFAQAWRKARNAERKAFYLREWHSEQSYFDGINDNLPPRYQAKLADRSWKEGASRPGSQKKVVWPGERPTRRSGK